jgi:hypothetical protein
VSLILSRAWNLTCADAPAGQLISCRIITEDPDHQNVTILTTMLDATTPSGYLNYSQRIRGLTSQRLWTAPFYLQVAGGLMRRACG